MIKVYLDWNCITHSKDKFAQLKKLLEQYKYVFICPYSIAHLRDVQKNRKGNDKEYERDLDLLTEICGKHLLLIEDNRIRLLNANPRDYLVGVEKPLGYLQNKFAFPYFDIRKIVQSHIPQELLHRISIENDPKKVFPLINKEIENYSLPLWNISSELNNLETQIRQEYYFLDLMGYRKEDKNKSFANIDTDAQHITYAGMCDYLITDDRRMRDKAKSIFHKYRCLTKVLSPESFIVEIPKIVQKCFDEELIHLTMQKYGLPTMQEDGAHLKKMEYPLWGLFNFCYTLDSVAYPNRAIFFTKGFMFYDEFLTIVTILSVFFPKLEYENYMQSYIQSKQIEDFAFSMNCSKGVYHFVLTKFEGLPALKVQFIAKQDDIN